MVKKKRKRELEAPGKGSQFILHGEEVPQSKITRFEERMQRSSKINEEDTLSDVATPASLACLTPKPTTLNIAELADYPTNMDCQYLAVAEIKVRQLGSLSKHSIAPRVRHLV